MNKLQKSISSKKFALGVLAFFALFNLSAKAGLPEKYGERFSSDGKVWYKVQLAVDYTPAMLRGYKLPNLTSITYNSDGSIFWDWGNIFDGGGAVKGTRIDEAGSFTVKAGDYIGSEWIHTNSGTYGMTAEINIFPMMQYDGLDILIPGRGNIIFRVFDDNRIRMECDIKDIPSEAKIGFGPVETNYNEWGGSSGNSTYEYGPGWQMFLDFCMTPVYMGLDSVDGIIDDSMKTDAPVYDILGHMVDRNNLTPGIYIYKGKKILVK